jgi:hypothetical protein
MTGVEINQIFSQQIGQTYSGVEDIAKKNRRFKKALINAIEEKYRNLNEQREYDELRDVIKTNVIASLVNNSVDIVLNDISHVLSIKAKYKKDITNLVIKDITNATPIVINLFTPNNIRSGDTLSISGVQGNQAANGEYTAIVNGRFKVGLYTANGPTTGNGQFVQSPNQKISRVFYNYCQFLKSDEKISSFKQATEDYPLYEVSFNELKVYPYTPGVVAPLQVTVDYISRTVTYFDLNDNLTDYTGIYPEKFIYHVIDLAAKDFDISFRDYQNSQATDQQIMFNP